LVHCPECEAALQDESDLRFVESAAETGIIAASKRFYVAECAACGATIASGVAGAKAGRGAT
jgi:translation initiation factor 2 beta subunit (eIF-2beta)/eIF-5